MRSKSPVLKERIIRFIDEFYRSEHRSPSFREIGEHCGVSKIQAYRYVLDMNENGILEYDGETIRTKTCMKCTSPARISVPLVGRIGCGDPTTEEENIEEYVNLPESIFGTGDLYLLRAYGDSMLDAGIEPETLVVVDKAAKPRIGDIVVVLSESNERKQ